MKNKFSIEKHIYPTGLALLALLVFIYIFNPQIDINGDNCYYYAFASALAAGEGYVDIAGEPSALFPPGYPLLMTPLRFITDSVVAQKVMNLLFLFGAVLLLFHTLLAVGVKRSLAFLAAATVLITPHLLEFSTMMMSEASCVFFIVLSLWAYMRVDAAMQGTTAVPWRSIWLWVFLFSVAYAFLIRTQAVVLLLAFLAALLLARRFKIAALLAVVFAACWLPWALRNAALGLGQSRYVSQIDFSNIPGNIKMLVVQALPESIVPFMPVRYDSTPSPLLYIIAAVMLALIIYGFFKMKGLRVVLPLLFVGNIAMVSIMNTPSYYRYMVIVLPFVTAGLVVGLWSALNLLCERRLKRSLTPWVMLLLIVPAVYMNKSNSKHSIYGLHKMIEAEYPPAMLTYLAIGKEAAKLPDARLVASRKPELLYVHTGVRGKRIKEDNTNVDILNNLLDENIDYLVLDNMGFKYTYEVLYPFIKHHQDMFQMVKYTRQPTTVLFRFNKELATQWLTSRGYR